MSSIRSICPYCGVGCGVLIDVQRGRVAGVEGDPDHPTNRGGLCAKGKRLAEVVRTPDRLLHPLARPARGAGFDRRREPARVSWEQALATVAGGIRHAIAQDGPGAVALYLSGQLLTEDYYVANKLAKGLLRTPNVDTNSRLCMSSTVAAYKRSLGADGPPGCYDDLEAAGSVLLWGSNAADTHPILFGRLRGARERSDQRWTVIDPRRTPTAEAADAHLAIRPGTDVALALGMTATLFQEGLVSEAAAATCSGLDGLRAAAAEMPPERAAEVCGVAAQSIRGLARELAAAPAALSLWCQGLNQSSAGTDKVSAVINLHLLTGQIGRPGAGPFSLTGQSNAMGGREVGGMATELAAHRSLEEPGDRRELERFWGLGPVPDRRGLTAVELVDAMLERRVRVLWVACSNPAASLPDGRAVEEALGKLDLLVVQELYHPTDTSRLADVVLPAAGWAEKCGTQTSSERRVAISEAAVAAPGEARADWEIFAAVARELGGGDAFDWPDAAAVFAEHVELTRGRDLDMTGLSHDELRRRGPTQWPFPEGGLPQARRYGDGRYPTPDGRARLIPVRYRQPAEAVSAEFPLALTTGRNRDSWHTLTRTSKVAGLRAAREENLIVLSPVDAQKACLDDGSRAVVSSLRGRVLARVAVDAGQPQGLVFMPFHRGPLLEPAGWTNTLPGRFLDPVSMQPELKHAAVRVEPAPRRFALAGGELAAAVAERLRAEGLDAVALDAAGQLEVRDGVLRVDVPGELDGAPAWWDLAGRSELVPAPWGSRLAEVDLRESVEPMAALPALRAAGWTVQRRGGDGIPGPVLDLLDRALPEVADQEAELVLGAPRGARPAPPPGVLQLMPGGPVSGRGPLSGDPATLAAYLAGRIGQRAALLRLVVPIGRLALVVIGDSSARDGVDRLVHEDGVAGQAQVWSVSSGELVGVAALVPPAVAEDIERAWISDIEPATLRARLPFH